MRGARHDSQERSHAAPGCRRAAARLCFLGAVPELASTPRASAHISLYCRAETCFQPAIENERVIFEREDAAVSEVRRVRVEAELMALRGPRALP